MLVTRFMLKNPERGPGIEGVITACSVHNVCGEICLQNAPLISIPLFYALKGSSNLNPINEAGLFCSALRASF